MIILLLFVLGLAGWLFSGLMLKWFTYELVDAGYLSFTMDYTDALQASVPLWLFFAAIGVASSSRN